MALYLIVVQAHFVMNNIFEGMIWFFLPAALVITNDIFAYICGIAFGRTQLIKLSPKKTVEGFVGAWIATVLFGMVLVNIMIRSKYFICPVNVSFGPCFVFRGCLFSTNAFFFFTQDLGATILRASNATRTPSSSLALFTCPSFSFCPKTFPTSPSRLPPCSFTHWSWRRLPL